MFEDGPPPLPPPLPTSELITDSGLADLNDDNRLTAVADDVGVNDGPVSCSPLGLPSFDPEVFITVAQPTVILESVCDASPPTGNDTHEACKTEGNVHQESSITESSSELNRDRFDVVHPEIAEEVLNSEEKRVSEDIQQNEAEVVLKEMSAKECLPLDSDHLAESVMSTEIERVDAGLQPNRTEDTANESKDQHEVLCAADLQHQELVSDEEMDMLSRPKRPVNEAEAVNEKITEQPSASSSFLEGVDGVSTAVSGVFEEKTTESQPESDEDFGDFEEFGEFTETPLKSEAITIKNEERNDFDGWAAFEDAQSDSRKPNNEGDDEWAADFANAPAVPVPAHQETLTSNLQRYGDIQLCALHEVYDESSLWTADNVEWDDSRNEPESSDDEMESVMEDLDRTDGALTSLRPWQSLWLAISIVEDALALKMQWTHSAFYSHFLDSLNLDENLAMMRNSNLPAFAQQLDESAILQPMTSIDVGDIKSETTSQVSNSGLSQSNSSTALPLNVSKGSGHSSAQPTQRPRSVPVDSLAVPPAQFDWGNSGLTNPLTAGSISASSALLDLDFLTANESRIVTIAGRSSTTADISAALQKDLAALGLDASEMATQKDATLNNTTENKASLLEQLMRKGKHEHKYTPPSELSLDARALHDRLPDLDYMLANVLLFPMANR